MQNILGELYVAGMTESLKNSNLEKPIGWLGTTVQFVIAAFLFLLAIDLVGESFTMLGQETARSILLATSNPFIGLFIGLLATALIQSSSTVTSMTVAVVASGYLTLENAIPVVMGANVGTTLTSTLVSLGFITKRNQFRKAISAGSIHDFFNIITVLIVFPLEYYYGTLTFLAQQLTRLVQDSSFGIDIFHTSYGFGISRISRELVTIFPQNIITLVCALILLFISIKFLSNIIYKRLIGTSKDRLKRFIFDNPYKSFGWGFLVTAGVQSSSVTTSLIVPLVASGKVLLSKSFPFVMGANIGTTITALLAAFNKSDAAISLAFVHLLFNLIGVLVFLPFPILRRIPVLLASKFGALTLDSRMIGFSYILFTFFLMPFALIYFNKGYVTERTYLYENQVSGAAPKAITIQIRREVSENKLEYYVFRDDAPVESSLPDTIFMIRERQQKFASTSEIFTYDFATSRFNKSDKIISKNDTATYTAGTLNLEHLNYFEVQLPNSHTGHYWFDPDQKVLIRSAVYDQSGNLIKSSKLISIQ